MPRFVDFVNLSALKQKGMLKQKETLLNHYCSFDDELYTITKIHINAMEMTLKVSKITHTCAGSSR